MARAKKRAAKRPTKVVPPPSSGQATDQDDDLDFAGPVLDPKRAALEAVAARFTAWRPASEVLTRVRAVPTCFVQYDRATRVGGHPIERFATIHGPSGHGKTTFCHGLGASFLERGHYYGFIDAERTTPTDWLYKLTAAHAASKMFVAMHPDTYEEAVDAVRDAASKLVAAKKEEGSIIAADTSMLFVVDSLRKLVPKDIFAKISKHGAEGGKGSIDGMGGRAAQIKAAMNAAWLDELIPLLHRTGTAMVAIARESENTDGNIYAPDYKMTGGKAIEYDSSLVIRVTRGAWVKDGSGEDAPVVGERHRLTIRKTKVSGKEDKNIVCYFHTSNGNMVPEGFDRARDVLELARHYKIVAVSGSWLSWAGMRVQGDGGLVRKLHERPDALMALEREVRQRFAPDEDLPVEDEA